MTLAMGQNGTMGFKMVFYNAWVEVDLANQLATKYIEGGQFEGTYQDTARLELAALLDPKEMTFLMSRLTPL